MATKCITITTDAYDALASLKQGSESFSDVITRITKKKSLLNLAGILTPKEGEELRRSFDANKKAMEKESNDLWNNL